MSAFDDLAADEFAAAGGYTLEQVSQARRNGELFSCRIGGEPFGRYPIYQLWDGIAGQSLRALVSALGADGGPTLHMFMSGASEILGGACAVELLCGKLLFEGPVQEGVAEFLQQDHFTRFTAVLKAAQTWQIEDGPVDPSELEDRLRRKAEVSVLGAMAWIARPQLEARARRDTVARWLERHEIFSIPSAIGLDLFPPYVFAADGKPLPVIPEILRWLEYPSGMSTAVWFESTSAFLGGARRRDLILSDPQRVIAAAYDDYAARHHV